MSGRRLSEYIAYLEENGLLAGEPAGTLPADRTVEHLSFDSRDVTEGTLFVCKGEHFRQEFLVSAARSGAFCYLSEKEYPAAGIPCIPVKDIRKSMAMLANFHYEDPWTRIPVIGITGTKGKSSTAYFVKSVLDSYMEKTGGKETGIISSIDTYDGRERFESHLTTPEPIDLERHFSNAFKEGLSFVTMEVSSQALKYDRVLGVRFAAGAFLNIDYDHISPIEHPDWEDYFTSKLALFRQCEKAVVNLDSDHIDRVLKAAEEAGSLITFSEKDENADFFGFNVRKDREDTVFCVRSGGEVREYRLGVPGLFNVSNALAAIAICSSFGVPAECIYDGLLRARVPGRMEMYPSADGKIISIVDYAHNRLSFEKLFDSVRTEYPDRRVVIVFGCPGRKALDRRHDLGQIAGMRADHVFITEEDPGEEDVNDICAQIASSVAEQGCPYTILTDRGDAIRAAVDSSDVPTVILITGKGAETREKRGTEYIPVPSDVEYVTEALREYDAR